MKRKTLLITTLGALTFASANAGDPDLDVKAVIEESSEYALTGDLTAGYDTRYIYRGLWFGNNSVWGNLGLSKQIAPKLTLSASALYLDIPDDDLSYSEADFGVGLSYESDYGTFSIGSIYYYFFDGFAGNNGSAHGGGGHGAQSDATEVNLGFSRELFSGVNLSLLAANDFRIQAQYYEVGLGKSWALCDQIGIDTSVAVGYGANDYYSHNLSGDSSNDFTHLLVSVAAPIQLAENIVLRPHVSANFSGNARKNGNAGSIGDSEVFYGVSLAVGF